MTFDRELLASYKALLQRTNLQKAYQEFVRLFRYLRCALEQQMPDWRFQSGISENAMDYAYFSFTNQVFKEHGLKLTVAFVHRTFQLEVWLSGMNRGVQHRWAERLKDVPFPMKISDDPAHTDYLVRLPVQADLSDGDASAEKVKEAAEKLVSLLLP